MITAITGTMKSGKSKYLIDIARTMESSTHPLKIIGFLPTRSRCKTIKSRNGTEYEGTISVDNLRSIIPHIIKHQREMPDGYKLIVLIDEFQFFEDEDDYFEFMFEVEQLENVDFYISGLSYKQNPIDLFGFMYRLTHEACKVVKLSKKCDHTGCKNEAFIQWASGNNPDPVHDDYFVYCMNHYIPIVKQWHSRGEAISPLGLEPRMRKDAQPTS